MEPFGKSEAHRTSPKNILKRIVRGETSYPNGGLGVDVSEIKEKVNEPDSENHSELNPGRSRITRQKKVDKSSTSSRVQSGDSDQKEYLLHL